MSDTPTNKCAWRTVIGHVISHSYLIYPLLAGGCFYVGQKQIEDIVERPSSEWSSRDRLTIMMQVMTSNVFDLYSPNVKVIGTPYYPSVITAINRTDQSTRHLSEEEYRLGMDQQFHEDLGLFIDWNARRLVDGRGNYCRNLLQIDSMTFLISIANKNWPCVSPIMVFGDVYRPLLTPADYPCYTPEITHLEDSIFLFNDRNEFIKARNVSGRQRTELTMEETLLAKFCLRNGEHHFLSGVKKMYVVIRGFDARIKLEFPLIYLEGEFRQF